MAVRVLLPYAFEVCRGQEKQLGLVLPIPPRLEKDMKAAASRRTLMDRLAR